MTFFKRFFLSLALIASSAALISPALADENAEFSFEIANNLNLDAGRSITAVPDVTIVAKKSFEGNLAVTIPLTLKGIFSQDLVNVQLGGNAANKVEPLTVDDLSLDQRSLNLRLSAPLMAQDTIIISGLQFKLYQEDNMPQPMALSYQLDGGTFTLNSANTIRLDADGVRRRFNTPEPVRNVTFTPVNGTGLEIRWAQNPDLDGIGYELTVKPTGGSTAVLDRFFIEKNSPTYTLENLNPNFEYTITISTLNNGGQKSDVIKTYQLPAPEIDSNVDDYKNLKGNAVLFATLYEQLVPAESRQFPVDGAKTLTNKDLFDLLKKTTAFSSISSRTQLYLQRFEKTRARFFTQDLTNYDFIRLLSLVGLRERIRSDVPIVLPNLQGKPIAERRHLLQVHKLQRKGLITDASLVADPMGRVSTETFYNVLSDLLSKLQ